jgi:hypothetical protein
MTIAPIRFSSLIDWIMAHPKKHLAFGDSKELDISLLFDTTRKNLNFHVVADTDHSVIALIIYKEYPELKELYIEHILASKGGFKELRQAWNKLYPGYTVRGNRIKNNKKVKHSIEDFV